MRYLREYNRLRSLGWSANAALRCAKTKARFNALGEEHVRVRIEPADDVDMDDLKGDMFNRRANPDIPEQVMRREEKAFEELVNREGVWGIISEYRDPNTGKWEHADSCWGFVGVSGVHDSGYDTDCMDQALDAHADAWDRYRGTLTIRVTPNAAPTGAPYTWAIERAGELLDTDTSHELYTAWVNASASLDAMLKGEGSGMEDIIDGLEV